MAGFSLSLLLVAGGVTWTVLDQDTYVAPTPSETPREPAPALAAAALSELVRAVDNRDVDAAKELGAGAQSSGLLAAVVTNAEAARVSEFSLRYVDQVGPVQADGSWTAVADATWAFRGFDEAPARAEVRFTFQQTGEQARLVGIGGGDRRSPVWMTGPADIRRTPRTLVVAAGESGSATRLAEEVRRAVPAVLAVLPDWDGGLVFEVPGSVQGLHEALDADPGSYDAIAAVTTTVDGSLAPDAPVHVFVNPRVFGDLRPRGAQVVVTHEATHVATDAAVSSMPLWLLEGFADYVALRDVTLPLGTTAGQIIREVRRQGPPGHLPGPDEFDTRATHLGASYEAAWLAVRLLADRGGQSELVRFYEAVDRGASVDAALEDTFDLSVRAFTAAWRDRLAEVAR